MLSYKAPPKKHTTAASILNIPRKLIRRCTLPIPISKTHPECPSTLEGVFMQFHIQYHTMQNQPDKKLESKQHSNDGRNINYQVLRNYCRMQIIDTSS
jgi:hypothetical protein